jgi:hypothetical protein
MIRSVLTPIEMQNLKKLCQKLGIDESYIDPQLDYYENKRALYEFVGKTPEELNSGLIERKDPYNYYSEDDLKKLDQVILYDFIDIPIKNNYNKVIKSINNKEEEFDFDFILAFTLFLIFLVFIICIMNKYFGILLLGA